MKLPFENPLKRFLNPSPATDTLMSAIFGIRSSNNLRPSLTDMQRLQEYLSYRGPDDSGIWFENEVGLGKCLLHTAPEHSREEILSPRSDALHIITADARLDNRSDLISLLGVPQEKSCEISDSDLILRAFEKWGEECPNHLLGDFAFAIWNRQTRQLFCARDHFGVRPFYYAHIGSQFASCSCVDGLLRLDWIPRRLNERRVGNHLTTFFGDTVETFYRDIARLPPAHSLVVSESGLRVSRYWELNPEIETRFGSDAEYIEAFRSIFHEAVRTRLRTACKSGAMLSGGLDSSSIAAVAGKILSGEGRGRLATFSYRSLTTCRTAMNGGTSSRRWRTEVLTRPTLRQTSAHPFLAPPEASRAQAEVLVAANQFLTWGLYDLARKKQTRVILDGFDGDTTISHGVGYLSELARTHHWLKLTRLLPAAAPACGRSASDLWWAYVWHEGLLPRTPNPVVRLCRGVARRWSSLRREDTACDCILNPAFVDRVGLRQYRASLNNHAPQVSPHSEKQEHYQKLLWGVMPATIEIIHHAAAAFGIEVRFPFWDRRLIEFCLGLPPRFKIRGGYTRWILRSAMEGYLPPDIQWRRGKANLGHAFRHCMLSHGNSVLNNAITSARRRLHPYLCTRHFERSLNKFARYSGDREGIFLWQVANLTLWMEKTGIQP